MTIIPLMHLLMMAASYGQIEFVKVYGGGSYDVGRALAQTADDGYVLAGSTGSFELDNGQFMLIRIDAWGTELWRRYYGGIYADMLESMAQTADGGLIMTGFTETLDKSYQIQVIRTDANGEPLWAKVFGGDAWDVGKHVKELSDGRFAIAGQTYSEGAGQGDAYLLILDAAGDSLWARTYGGTQSDGAGSVAETGDGGFILAGHTESVGAGGRDAWLLRLNAEGDTIWTRTYGGEEEDMAHAVLRMHDGNFAMAGHKVSNGAGGKDLWLAKVNANGNTMWESFFGGPNDDVWYDLIQLTTNELVVAGFTHTTEIGGGGEDMYVGRWRSDGVFGGLLTTYGREGDESAYGVIETSDGGLAVIGQTDGYLYRMEDVLMVKTANGVSTSLLTDVREVVVDGEAHQLVMAPNPFNGTTVLTASGIHRWGATFNRPVVLEVFDAFGRQVFSTQVVQMSTAVDLTGSAGGMYGYRLTAGSSFIAAGRLMHLKE